MICTRIALATLLLTLPTTKPLENFLKRYFQNETIVIIGTEIDQKLINLTPTKVLANPNANLDLTKFDNYIITEKNITNNRINTRGKFLVIFTHNSEDELRNVFETLWRAYIYNVVAYNWTTFVTWYPYSDRQCGEVAKLVTVTKSLNPYKNKIPSKINCPVNITWEEHSLEIKNPFNKTDPGYNIRQTDAIAEMSNLDLIYLTENINYFTLARAKASYEDLMEEMTERPVDLAFVISEQGLDLGPKFEFSSPLSQTNLYFVFPPRRKIISSTDTLVIFSPEIWTALSCSVILMTILWKNLSQKSLQTCFFEIIQLALQGSINQTPANALQRLLFASFFFSLMNLNWMYVSQLSGVLSQPSYEPKILNFADLAKSNKKLKFVDVMTKFLVGRHFYDEIMKKRIENPTGISHIEEMEDFFQKLEHGIVLSDTQLAVIRNCAEMQLVSDEKIITFYTFLVVKKGFPLLGTINNAIRRITESGLLSRWMYESRTNIEKVTVPNYKESADSGLDLERVLSAFVLLGVGLLLSTAVFIFEFMSRKQIKS